MFCHFAPELLRIIDAFVVSTLIFFKTFDLVRIRHEGVLNAVKLREHQKYFYTSILSHDQA
jgi:hypothetical protein